MAISFTDLISVSNTHENTDQRRKCSSGEKGKPVVIHTAQQATSWNEQYQACVCVWSPVYVCMQIRVGESVKIRIEKKKK